MVQTETKLESSMEAASVQLDNEQSSQHPNEITPRIEMVSNSEQSNEESSSESIVDNTATESGSSISANTTTCLIPEPQEMANPSFTNDGDTPDNPSASQATINSVGKRTARHSRLKNEISNLYSPSRSGRKSTNTAANTNNITSPVITSSTPSPMNGQPCIIHTPTLEELQSMTFTEYIRTKVLPAAAANIESDDDDDHDDAGEEADATIGSTQTTTNTNLTPTKRTCSTSRNGKTSSQSILTSSETMVLREGIAKIRLPKGFFPSPPYGKDTTGRGPVWASGTPLGDKKFNNPIAQHIRGMTGVYEYTFTELPATTLAEFRDRADKYRISQVGSIKLEFKKEDDNTENNKESKENIVVEKEAIPNLKDDNENIEEETTEELTTEQVAQLERQFWKRLSPTMPPAVYGADEPGTLFGDYDASGWSLANLDSCLHVLSTIPGVTSPYLYAGMWASVFCAHTEDMNLLSINYLHAGQPKIWYAVAEQDAARFVSLAEHHFVHQLQKCKEFLRHKRCLLSPLVLQKAGIRYQTAIQYPGDAVITFPGGYHFGFNAGFNIAEATNFGVLEWLPFGRKAKICLCRPDSVRIDMNRLTYLLQRYQVDVKRNKRLTWKEWRKRYERKEGIKSESKSEIIETEDEIIEVISYAPKKRTRKRKDDSHMSEQERKHEFWIEVTLPSQLRKNSNSTKKQHKSKKSEENPWYLAKPVGRKRLEINMKVLCLVPAPLPNKQIREPLVSDADSDDVMSNDEGENNVEEHCFTGTIVRIDDGHALIHFDGQSKASDIWMPLSSPKIFLNGGLWSDEKVNDTAIISTNVNVNDTIKADSVNKSTTLPVLHYWKEMDSNVLPL